MIRVNYRIVPYAGGWGVFDQSDICGPYLSIEFACRVALAMLRTGAQRGEQGQLLFDDGTGKVKLIWPRNNPMDNVHMLVKTPWGGSCAVTRQSQNTTA